MAESTSSPLVSLLRPLPDDLALLCLARVPVMRHGCLRLVNSAWRAMVVSEKFRLKRKELGLVEDWIILLSKEVEGQKLLRRKLAEPSEDDKWSLPGDLMRPVPLACYIFNVGQGTWVRVPLPEELKYHKGDFSGVVFDGKLYILGGTRRTCSDTDIHHVPGSQKEVWRYDPGLNIWRMVATMPEARSHSVVGVVGEEIHLMGGNLPHKTKTCVAYNPKQGSWRKLGNVPGEGQADSVMGAEIDGAMYGWTEFSHLMGPFGYGNSNYGWERALHVLLQEFHPFFLDNLEDLQLVKVNDTLMVVGPWQQEQQRQPSEAPGGPNAVKWVYIRRYDKASHKWVDVATMDSKSCVSGAKIRNKLYVVRSHLAITEVDVPAATRIGGECGLTVKEISQGSTEGLPERYILVRDSVKCHHAFGIEV